MIDGRDFRRMLALFLVSGALGLGYQVLWSKLVLLFVGVSSWSYAIVLAAFMAGLAIGSRVVGSLADRVANPLKLFAFLELGIGLFAVAYSPLSQAAGSAYLTLASSSPDQAGGMHGLGVKAALAGLLLLPPTILMGGTYPAMLRHASTSLAVVGRRASLLYAVNALGAVAGALGMAFLLLPALGCRGSLMAMALGNAVVGLVALVLARREPGEAAEPDSAGEAIPPAAAGTTHRGARWLPAIMFSVGALAFTYEVAWTRYFSLVVGSSTYSFAIILAAFISGIAIAGAVVARLGPRAAGPLLFFGGSQVAAALLVLLVLPLHPYLPWAFGRLADVLPSTGGAYLAYEGTKLLACWLVMLPAASMLGMSIPLAVMFLARDLRGVGRDAGRIYAWNTAGNVAGALVAGLVLLPWLGMELLLRSAALATAAVGLFVIAVATPTSSGRWRRGVLPAAAVLGLATLLPAWNEAWFTLTPFRRQFVGSLEQAKLTVAGRKVILFQDDPAANIIILEEDGPDGLARSLLVNGKPDASSLGDMPTQILIGVLPCILHPAPKDVMVVGLASGATSGAMLGHDAVERLDVVDIVQGMKAASRHFDEWSGAPLDDPRTRFVADDARSFLSTTSRRYDVIVSEPSNPWIAGTGSLFADEFYRRASLRLKPGGLFCQWIQAYEMSDATLASIMATFRATFPDMAVFEVAAHDLIVVGSFEPLRLDPATVARGMGPRVREQLAGLGIDDPLRVLYLQCFSQVTCDWIASLAAVLNTDDNLLLEHDAPRDLFMRARPTLVRRLDERALASPSLAWARAVAAGGDHLGSIHAMKGRVFGNSGLYTAALTAIARTRGIDGVSAELRPVLPAGKAFLPTTDGDVITALRDAVDAGDGRVVERVAAEQWATLANEALLSPSIAEAWQIELAALARAAPEPARATLELVRADVLAAAGRMQEAMDQLGALEGRARPDDLVLRACRLDAGEACDAMARRFAHGANRDALRRFVEIRSASRRSTRDE